jgi:hypothetical protein
MKKLNESIRITFNSMTLYYEDIETIYNIFKENSKRFEVVANGYEIEVIEDILQIKKPFFNDLKIQSFDPYISLDFRNSQIELYASEDTTLYLGIVEKIKKVLKEKESRLTPILRSRWSALLAGAALMPAFEKNLFGIVGLSIAILWFFLGLWSYASQPAKIIPQKKEIIPNFVARNKDKIILGILSSIGGMAMMYLAQYFGLAIK